MSELLTLNSNWPFFTASPRPRVNLDDSSRGERRHRHLARDVGIHHSGYVQFRRRDMLTRRRQRELLGVIHLEVVGIHIGHHCAGDRTAAGRDGHLLSGHGSAASGKKKSQAQTQRCLGDKQTIHSTTSRPTAMFICAAATKYEPIKFK